MQRNFEFPLPRRDLMAILPYLDRKEFDDRPAWKYAKQVDGVLLRLAASHTQ